MRLCVCVLPRLYARLCHGKLRLRPLLSLLCVRVWVWLRLKVQAACLCAGGNVRVFFVCTYAAACTSVRVCVRVCFDASERASVCARVVSFVCACVCACV